MDRRVQPLEALDMKRLVGGMGAWADLEYGHSIVLYMAAGSVLLFLATFLRNSKKVLVVPAYVFAWMALAYVIAIMCSVVISEYAPKGEKSMMSLNKAVWVVYSLELWGMGLTWFFSDSSFFVLIPAPTLLVVWILGGLWYEHAYPILPDWDMD